MQSFLAMKSRERKTNNLVAFEIFIERAVKPLLDVEGSSRPFPLTFEVRSSYPYSKMTPKRSCIALVAL